MKYRRVRLSDARRNLGAGYLYGRALWFQRSIPYKHRRAAQLQLGDTVLMAMARLHAMPPRRRRWLFNIAASLQELVS